MNAKEAIEALKLEGGIEITGNPVRIGTFLEALVEAEKALEKQEAKRPIWENGSSIFCKDYADGRGEITKEKWAEWTCPNCGWFVGEQYIPIHHNQRKSNYCPKCGQAIQWENLEEMEE